MRTENTLEKESHLAHAIRQTGYRAKYDAAAKKLLANRIVLAHILKGCVEEYSGCSIREIAEKYIEGEPEVGTTGVHKDDTNCVKKTDAPVTGESTEDTSQTEGTIYYDVRFHAVVPGAAEKERFQLIINVEAQNKFHPGYPLTKRAVYYGSRMISAQYGPVFTGSQYQKIRKVYTIWVCTNPPKRYRNTITRYSIRPEMVVGEAAEKRENYDLMSVVMICLGEPGTKDYAGLLKFLEVLFSTERTADEKKEILESDFEVPMTETFESEVREMCNLSEGVMEKGIEKGLQEGMQKGMQKGLQKGMEKGEIRMLVKQVKKGRLTIQQAAEDAEMTIDQFQAEMEQMV